MNQDWNSGGGAQSKGCEEVMMAPIDPAGRDEEAREDFLCVSGEHVDYPLDDLLRKMRRAHFGTGGRG